MKRRGHTGFSDLFDMQLQIWYRRSDTAIEVSLGPSHVLCFFFFP